jgi:hypothetical protein
MSEQPVLPHQRPRLWIIAVIGGAVAILFVVLMAFAPSQQQHDFQECMEHGSVPPIDAADGLSKDRYCQTQSQIRELERHPPKFRDPGSGLPTN